MTDFPSSPVSESAIAAAYERFPDAGDAETKRAMGTARYGFLEGYRSRDHAQCSRESLVHIDNVVYHLDDIEVDADGKCAWTDVANALTHIKMCIEPTVSDTSTDQKGNANG